MRRGFGILAPVIALAVAAGVIVLAIHSLWRGSSRTLFSVQEQRQLASVARSAIEEACFRLQSDLDWGDRTDEAWFRDPAARSALNLAPERTRDALDDLKLVSSDGVTYAVSDVTVTRVRPLAPAARGAVRAPGIVDFGVTVTVKRGAPRHEATLTVTDRRAVRMADDHGPFAFAGKHVEISASSAARRVEVN